MAEEQKSLQWWRDHAAAAREMVHQQPESPEACCLLAMSLGRCRIMGGELDWKFSVKRAIYASDAFFHLIEELLDRVMDVAWLHQLLPEALPDLTALIISRRVDVMAVQLTLGEAFEQASERWQRRVDNILSQLVDALAELDTELWAALQILRDTGGLVDVAAQHRDELAKGYQEQWWLSGQEIEGS